jgi:hypothetical protein
MNTKSRIVAFAAVFALAGLALPADPAAAADRRSQNGGAPQQGMSSSHQAGPMDGQAKYQADYHADYRSKGTQDEAASKDADARDGQRERDRDQDRRASELRDRMLGRTPGVGSGTWRR